MKNKQIIESNEVAKNDFNIDRRVVSHEKQKEIFEFSDIKYKIDLNNLVYTFKTDGNEPKDFRNFKAPLKLFEDLREGNINPKEALKSQARFAQVKAGYNSQSLLNEIRQIVYSLYQAKEITKKVFNNIIKSIKV